MNPINNKYMTEVNKSHELNEQILEQKACTLDLVTFVQSISTIADLFLNQQDALQNFLNKLTELNFSSQLRILYETENGLLKEIAHSPGIHPLHGIYPVEEFFDKNPNIESIDHNNLYPNQKFDDQYFIHPLSWDFKEPKSIILFPTPLITNNETDLFPMIIKAIAFIVSVQFKITSYQKPKKNEVEFVSFASHQLKVPLTSLKTGVDVLKKQKFGQLDWRYSKILEIMETEIENMKELISRLLDLSRVRSQLSPEMTQVHIIKLFQEVSNSLEKIKEEKLLTFKLISNSSIYSFLSDAMLIKQIMNNLMHNASKYSPLNGRILVILQFDKSESTFTLTIADEGPGIEEDRQAFIFNEYSGKYSISSDFSTTGIGLSICRRIIELLSGKIYVESPCRHIFEKYGLQMKTESKGAAFTAKIPIKISDKL